MRNPILIYNHDGYTLESWDDGWAYTLTRTGDGAIVLIQDEGAPRFRRQFDAAFKQGREHVRSLFSQYLPDDDDPIRAWGDWYTSGGTRRRSGPRGA